MSVVYLKFASLYELLESTKYELRSVVVYQPDVSWIPDSALHEVMIPVIMVYKLADIIIMLLYFGLKLIVTEY